VKNLEIREAIKKNRLFHYEIAESLGISESAFSKLLRTEMNEKKMEQVMQAIRKIKEDCYGEPFEC